MKNKILTLTFCTLFSSPVLASNWNVVGAHEDSVTFFDADTVVKNREVTTLWVKSVQTKGPEKDGTMAIALNWRINCSKRTIQTLGWSTYTQDGKFMQSGQKSDQESNVIPDSRGEEILKIACEANFPRDTSGSKYFKVKNNDIFQFTKDYVEYEKNHQDNAPK